VLAAARAPRPPAALSFEAHAEGRPGLRL
jgi:hypothetical protein